MALIVESRVPSFLTAERTALISPEAMVAYDTETKSYWGFNGTVAGGVPLSGGVGGGGSPAGAPGSIQYNADNVNFGGGSAMIFAPAQNIMSVWHFAMKKSWALDGNFTYTAGAVAALDNLTFAELPETNVLFINPDAGTTTPLPFSGIVAPSAGLIDGRVLVVVNSGATKTLLVQTGNANSAAANQFAVGANFQIKIGQTAVFRYNLATTKWNCIALYGLGSSHTHTNGQGEGGLLDASAVFNTGALPVARGGTAIGSYTVGSLLWASAATTFTQLTTTGNGNKCLMVNAAGTAPVYKSQVYSLPKTLFLAAGIAATQDETIIKVPIGITIVSVDAHKQGAGTNVSFNLRWHADRSEPTNFNSVFTSNQTCNSGSGQTFNSGFSSPSIAAGAWFWLNINTIDASIAMFHVTINYTID
jgi:hypothetical protein